MSAKSWSNISIKASGREINVKPYLSVRNPTIFDLLEMWEPHDQGPGRFLFSFKLPFIPSKKQLDIVINESSSYDFTLVVDKEYGYGASQPIRIFRACIVSFDVK